jgi:DNA polymerase-3 subunit beta
MKVVCDRDQMLTAFGMISGVVPVRSPKAILQNIKLVADGDGNATLLATDLEVGIRYRTMGVKVDHAGAVVLPTQRVGSILRTSATPELAVETDADHIFVRTPHAEFKLPSEDPDLYPEVPDFGATAYYIVSSADLRRLIRRTVFATDIESTRYALGGVLFEMTPESITLVGTDGRRLARAVADAEAAGGVSTPLGNPVVPVKALKLIERNLNDDDPPVHLAFQGGTAVLVRTDRAIIYSRLVEGRFPRYQDVFPPQVEVKIPLVVGPLLSVVEQAAIVTSDESRGVDFTFGSGLLKLLSQAADVGTSHVDLPISYDGKPVEITFDPRYLIDALKTLDPAAPINVELIDQRNAAVFRTEDRYTYVVMPLTREE